MSTKVHHLGEGWEPHVDEIEGQLIYSLPVDSGAVSLDFEFPIETKDLAILKVDKYRYAVLYFVLHEELQNKFGIGHRSSQKMQTHEFRSLVNSILHSSDKELESYLKGFQRENKCDIHRQVSEFLARKSP